MNKKVLAFLFLCVFTLHLNSQSSVIQKRNLQDSSIFIKANNMLKDAQNSCDKTLSLSEKNIEFANTLIQWTALILAFSGIVIAVGTYFGFREYSQIKKRVAEIIKIKKDSQKHLEEIIKIKEETIKNLQDIKKEFITKSETFMISSFNYNLGEQAYKVSDFEKAIEYFTNAYKYNPSDVHILCRIGRSLCNLDRNYQANEFFEKALQIEENSSEALSGLATSMRYIDIDKSIEFCKKALLANPNNAFLYDYLGLLYRDKNILDQSLECHNQSIIIDPTCSVSYFYLSLILAKLGKLKESNIAMLASIDRVENDKNLRKVWKQTIQVCMLILENKIDLSLKECIRQRELINNNNRVRKAVLSHIKFLLNALNLDNTNFLKILEND